MEAQAIVLAELGLTEATPQITLDLAKVEQYVKNYCNITEIPADLNFTIADMVLDLQQARVGDNIAITKVDMGDTSYSLKLDSAVKGLIQNYQANLNAFRKLRW